MTDKLKPGTKAWNDRQRRHRHNSFTGHAKMMQQQLRSIELSDSSSDEAKRIAKKMLGLTDDLTASLKTRIDP